VYPEPVEAALEEMGAWAGAWSPMEGAMALHRYNRKGGRGGGREGGEFEEGGRREGRSNAVSSYDINLTQSNK